MSGSRAADSAGSSATESGKPANIAHAEISPSAEFSKPDDVVNSAALSDAEKIKILRQWEIDCRALARAGDEGMPPKTAGVSIADVQKARAALGDKEAIADL